MYEHKLLHPFNFFSSRKNCYCSIAIYKMVFNAIKVVGLYIGAWTLAALFFSISCTIMVIRSCLTRLMRMLIPSTHAQRQPIPDNTLVEILDVGGIPTEIMHWDAPSDVTFVMFPGNPGACEFYIPFLSRVYEKSEQARRPIRIYCVGHAGHSRRTSGSGKHYNLKEQVAHKLAFLDLLSARHPDTSFILGGHSVGAAIAIEVARHIPMHKLKRLALLFPTIRHIGKTRNGVKLTPVFRHLRGPAALTTHAIASLPETWRKSVMRPFMQGGENHTLLAAESLIHPDVMHNALWMALHEMREILDLDADHFKRIANKTFLYFAERDDWVNDGDPHYLISTFPEAKVHICTKGHKHAFVLSKDASHSVGESVWDDIETTLQ